MESELVRDLGILTVVLGIIISLFRISGALRARGSKEQNVEDRLGNLEKSEAARSEENSVISKKLDDIRKDIHKLELCIVKSNGEHSERLTRLEATGCSPVRKDKDKAS